MFNETNIMDNTNNANGELHPSKTQSSPKDVNSHELAKAHSRKVSWFALTTTLPRGEGLGCIRGTDTTDTDFSYTVSRYSNPKLTQPRVIPQ